MVAAASDEGTALQLEEKFAEMEAMLAALKAAASRKRKSLQGEARLRARLQEQGLWNAWTRGGASILMWALQTLPECLLARSGMFPSHRVVKLAATSKRVRELLGHLQWRVPVALRMSRRASMESVASSLPGMLAWCSVVRLNVSMRKIDAEGVRILARALE